VHLAAGAAVYEPRWNENNTAPSMARLAVARMQAEERGDASRLHRLTLP